MAALRLLQQTGTQNHYDIFNIGTGQGNSVLELIRTFEAVSGEPLNYRIGPRRPGDITAVFADVRKAAALLGWEARRTLREALADAWRWQQRCAKLPV